MEDNNTFPGRSTVLTPQAVHPDRPVKKPLDKATKIEPAMNLKKQASFPEQEEERVVEDNNTFPGRSPVDDNIIVMKNFEKESQQNQTEDSSEQTNTKFMFVDSVTKSSSHYSLSYNYGDLWKYTKSFYCTSIVLVVEENKAIPITWTGKIKKYKDISIDLDDYSLFKIVKKGHSYNGFIVDTPANKKFFSQVGWEEYPKHVTAIPIKDVKGNLVNIFVGFSLNPVSYGKIQQIEENILKFFQTNYNVPKVA